MKVIGDLFHGVVQRMGEQMQMPLLKSFAVKSIKEHGVVARRGIKSPETGIFYDGKKNTTHLLMGKIPYRAKNFCYRIEKGELSEQGH